MAASSGKKNIERLADALQACFRDAVEEGKRAANGLDIRAELDKQNATLDKQNETLRMIWRQIGGSPTKRLPIDNE